MNKILLAITVLCIGLASCSKEVAPLTKEEMTRKVDSLVTSRRQESDMQARIDLDRRMKIEVKVKADSILNARLNPVKDTVKAVVKAGAAHPIPVIKTPLGPGTAR